ncbi:hypothetical protein EUTSA_v10028139mg, partial [Eutrema salsugineum]
EGKKPIFHKPKPRGIYASEEKAHLFYIPVSIKALRTSLGRDFQTPKSLADHLEEYVDLIAGKYKFWNRTGGADHFLVACHDWNRDQYSMHGYLRPILLQLWENKEPDMKILGPMPRDPQSKKQYREYMKSSRYCICARAYEVHTPRVVEAIMNECVPVMKSTLLVPPFFEVLEWEEFAVFVKEKDIPKLRNILLSIRWDASKGKNGATTFPVEQETSETE